MLEDMIEHFKNHESLLVRIYGVFTIQTQYFGSIDIILMENCFRNRQQKNPFMFFDFKGSTYKRLTKFQSKDKYWWRRKHN